MKWLAIGVVALLCAVEAVRRMRPEPRRVPLRLPPDPDRGSHQKGR